MGDGDRGAWDPPGEKWAMLFKHALTVHSGTIDAVVFLEGAVLAHIDESGRCWLDGVFPCEVSEGDDTLEQAYENFKTFLAGIVTDIAKCSVDFADFEQEVQRFAKRQGDDYTQDAWDEARKKVRPERPPEAPKIPLRNADGWKPHIVALNLSEAMSTSTERASAPAPVTECAPLQAELAA